MYLSLNLLTWDAKYEHLSEISRLRPFKGKLTTASKGVKLPKGPDINRQPKGPTSNVSNGTPSRVRQNTTQRQRLYHTSSRTYPSTREVRRNVRRASNQGIRHTKGPLTRISIRVHVYRAK